ncbi:sugar ABC transporter substrate-binding protein [Pseudoclavibacter chungangensis]|uniref:Sugar ABC transporter substrate-binding protein n=1 Tax=Pseudoclavibacter chungangensis TaxID=587635 RepID=A0A7J5BQ11_9MICO|nr:sugar ABC transporter substrate-binding protein [Pseudoclavibacter chungangensis]KAB1655399.1 sugar ABC transporter substrate-binding protein [Pseudoclavibacter chungangensis]NYJ68357.1 multiple sugar transport system substrate-binding protein [Pseudoclavibacter chungangensis]
MKPRKSASLAVGTVALLALAGCASGGGAGGDGSGDITLRLWDEQVATAYEASIDAFEAANPGVTVTIDVVPWADYFTTLRQDVAAGGGDDVFWLNGSYYQDYADNGLLRPVSETLGADAASAWSASAVEQYTRDGELWGVPQLVDGGSALYYNADLLAAAGVTPEQLQDLVWSPSDAAADTFKPVVQQLTVDAQGRNATDPAFDANQVASWGFNAAQDTQNVLLNFIGSNGGTYQTEDGAMTFTDPKTEEALAYVVDLINQAKVAPPASSTNGDGDYTRDQFLQGKIALFESGTYNLANVQQGAAFDWGVVEIPSGPEGKVTTSPAVIAAANANSSNPDAVTKLLQWLGSAEGNAYIGAEGAAVPAVTDARAQYDAYWQGLGVDVSPFFTVLDGADPLPAVTGQNYGAVLDAFKPHLDEVFLGTVDVPTGLEQAQQAADAVN